MVGRLRNRRAARRERQWRRRNRRTGCLLWLLVLILAVLAIALFFGGFTKGTKVGGIAAAVQVTAVAAERPAAAGASVPTR